MTASPVVYGGAERSTAPTTIGEAPTVRVDLRRLTAVAVAAIAAVNLANAGAILFAPWERPERIGTETTRWLLLAEENNPSTWLQSMLLAGAAGAALALAQVGTQRRGWKVAAGLLALLPLDEAASLHERLDDVVGADRLDLPTSSAAHSASNRSRAGTTRATALPRCRTT